MRDKTKLRELATAYLGAIQAETPEDASVTTMLAALGAMMSGILDGLREEGAGACSENWINTVRDTYYYAGETLQ